MKRCSAIVCAVLGAISATAHADAKADVKSVIAAQLAAVGKGDDGAFAATLDDGVFAMLPGGYAQGAKDTGLAVTRAWTTNDGLNSATLGKAVIGVKGTIAWATADVLLTYMLAGKPQLTPIRLTELFHADHGAWKAIALDASQAKKDDPEFWAEDAVAMDHDQPPGDDADAAPMKDWLAHPTDLAAHLRAGNDVVVLGSSAGERGDGAGAAKLLAGWKKLVFATDWARASTDDATYAWLAARVTRKVKGKHETIDEPYWALVLAVKGDHDWEIVSVHYAQ
jgi:hypothetical protein